MPFSLFAVSAPSLETLTAQELHALGLLPRARRMKPGVGGVEFHGDLATLYRANLHLRTASRVLVRLGRFHASEFYELQRRAEQLPWGQYLRPGQPVALRVTCHKSKLYHSDAVAERLVQVIGGQLGRPTPLLHVPDESEEAPTAPLLVVRLVHDQCTVSVDSSGAGLHKRGYRLATAKAPLRETLAAGLVLASAWDMRSPLLDPFCGAGTIAIEAAQLAHHIAPGLNRPFAFMDWPGFDKKLWHTLHAQAETEAETQRQTTGPLILASDRDAGAIEAAQANAARAGVGSDITFERRAVSAIEPPAGPGWIITNPPYGVRLAERQDLRNLYERLGQVLRMKCAGWQVGLLLGDEALQKSLLLPFDEGRSLRLINGGLNVKFARARVPPM